MKLEIMSVSIKGLFDRFDYTISFDKDINIITSPNGFGKSTILRFVYNLTNGNYHSFFAETFNEATFLISHSQKDLRRNYTQEEQLSIFDNGQILESGYKIIQFKKLNEIITITDLTDKRNRTVIIDLLSEDNYTDSLWKQIDAVHPYIKRVTYNTWENDYTGEVYNKEKLLQMCGNMPSVKEGIPGIKWVEDVVSNLKSYYITTDRVRVSDFQEFDKGTNFRRKYRMHSKSMIHLLAMDIKERIQSGIRQQFEMSRRRESTFPQRLIKSLESAEGKTTVEDVVKAIKDIQFYEERFSTLGILSDNTDRTTEQLNQFFAYSNETGLVVLKTYLDDIKTKFKVLDSLAAHLTLFKESVNNLLSFKKLNINLEFGIEVVSDKGDKGPIELSSLSSGEQHLIVMIGKMIFGASKGDLVLIDEPEISFHPEWQEIFIDIVNKIRELKDFKVVMATHSPILIGGRWDNVIELAEQHLRS